MNFLELSVLVEQEKITEAGGVISNLRQGFGNTYNTVTQPQQPQPQQNQPQNQSPFNDVEEDEQEPPDASTTQKILQAIGQGYSKANEYSKKLGVPLPLATTLITAGVLATMGAGPAIIPLAVVKYVVRNKARKFAGNMFDKVIPSQQQQQQPQQQQPQQQPQPQPMQQTQPQQQTQPMQTAGFIYSGEFTRFVEGEVLDKMANTAGKAAGWMAGKASNVAGKVSDIVNTVAKSVGSNLSSLKQWMGTNKVGIAKAAFLFSVGLLISGAMSATTAMADDQILQGLEHAKIPGTSELKGIIGNPNGMYGIDKFDLNTFPSAQLWTDWIKKTGQYMDDEDKSMFFGLDAETTQKMINMRLPIKYYTKIMHDIGQTVSSGGNYLGPQAILHGLVQAHEEHGGTINYRDVANNAKQWATQYRQEHPGGAFNTFGLPGTPDEKIANLAKSFAGEDDTFGDKANEITEKIKNIMKVTNKTPEQILVAAKKQGGFDKLYSAWQAYQNSKQ